MIIYDLDVMYSVVCPSKADAELIINPDAVLTSTIAFQWLKLITRRKVQVRQILSLVQLSQLANGHPGDSIESAIFLGLKEHLRGFVFETCDHGIII